MNTGTYRDLFGYSSDIQPKEVDHVHVRFEEDGKAICLYSDRGERLIAKYNHASPSAHFEEIHRFPELSATNIEWTKRQILQCALAKICGVNYVPNEDGISFAKRLEPYEWRWRRQQC